MSTPARKRGRPRRTAPPATMSWIHVKVPAALKDGLSEVAGRNLRRLSAELQVAIRAHLVANGCAAMADN